jgi:hypothetical protein
MFKGMLLETDRYSISAIEVNGRELRLQGWLVNSGMKFVSYKILKKNDTIFICIYGKLISPFDTPGTNTSGEISIQYSIPDDINVIYMRGINKNDLETVWKNE